MSKKDEERYLIDSFKDYEMDYYNDTKTAKEEGLKEGLDKGLKEGLDKGLKEGKVEIAKNMLKLNVDVNNPSQIMTLSTCYDNGNIRLAVHAIKVNEEINEL